MTSQTINITARACTLCQTDRSQTVVDPSYQSEQDPVAGVLGARSFPCCLHQLPMCPGARERMAMGRKRVFEKFYWQKDKRQLWSLWLQFLTDTRSCFKDSMISRGDGGGIRGQCDDEEATVFAEHRATAGTPLFLGKFN